MYAYFSGDSATPLIMICCSDIYYMWERKINAYSKMSPGYIKTKHKKLYLEETVVIISSIDTYL